MWTTEIIGAGVELEQPRQAVSDAGAATELLSIHDGQIAARNNDLEDAGSFTVDKLVSDASLNDYDACCFRAGRSTRISCR